jgi:hypothetical protein
MGTEARDMSISERQIIQDFLGEEAEKISREAFAGGVLTVWRNAHSLPSRRVCTFASSGRDVSVPNEGDESFVALLSQGVAMSASLPQLCNVIPLISPVPRKVVEEVLPYMKAWAAVWHPPQLREGRLECYMENLASGRVERLAVGPGTHQIEDVAAGLRFTLR